MDNKADENTNDFQPSPTMLYWDRVVTAVIAVFFIVIGVSICVLFPYTQKKGIDFPKKSQVQYSEGVLKVNKVYFKREVIPYIIIDNITYACSYRIHNSPLSDKCLPYSQLEPYIGQYAKVGWYTQKKFLWYNNPYRQLVFLQINGKTLKSYEQIKSNVEYVSIGLIIVHFIPFGMGLFLVGAGSLMIYRLVNGTYKHPFYNEIKWIKKLMFVLLYANRLNQLIIN